MARLNRETSTSGSVHHIIAIRRAAAYRSLIGVWWLLCGCLLSGCGSGEWHPGDADTIRMVIADISDARTNAPKLATLFAEGSVPDRTWLKKSAQWSFVVESVDVDGDLATAEITVENFLGDIVGTQTWICQRANAGWIIKNAPLP